MAAGLTEEEVVRYSRQLVLPEVGGAGQARLRAASVLVVGAGGLGSPAALYLAAAGVGRLGLADGDRVDLSNLQRQILHATDDLGRPKVESARERLLRLNPLVHVEAHGERVTEANAARLVGGYDVVISAVDNPEARYVLNDTCVRLGRPLVEAGVVGFTGFLMTVLPERGPCFRCVFPEPPADPPTCAEAGVLGALTGVLGSLQALEALKLLLGRGEVYAGRLLTVDGLSGRFREVPWPRDPACPACGAAAGDGSPAPVPGGRAGGGPGAEGYWRGGGGGAAS